ncbi:MAG: histidine--tRNA ligase [bacterium]
MKKSSKKNFQTVRGMRDILPSDWPVVDFVFSKVQSLYRSYGFDRIETPIVEDVGLFQRAVGMETDIVTKEMYSWVDQGDERLALRPEGTAGVVRAYIEHGMLNLPQPVKLWYWGQMFRRERPQAGRYRQFWQFGCEVLGSDQPVADAELIIMMYRLFEELGLAIKVKVNSLGSEQCRASYRRALTNYFKSVVSKLNAEQKETLSHNPLRLLDSRDPNVIALKEGAPQIIDYLNEDCREHFLKVVDYLDDLDIPYQLDYTLVRGLDYYNQTVFEFVLVDEQGNESLALGGGGRYDKLVEELGGRPTPAVGYAMGVERIINIMRERKIDIPMPPVPDVFLAQLGDEARKKSLKLFEELRRIGVNVSQSFGKEGIKQQMEVANKRGVKFTLILGQKEIMDGTILIRDMENGIQEVIDFNKIVGEVQKRLSKVNGNGQ